MVIVLMDRLFDVIYDFRIFQMTAGRKFLEQN